MRQKSMSSKDPAEKVVRSSPSIKSFIVKSLKSTSKDFTTDHVFTQPQSFADSMSPNWHCLPLGAKLSRRAMGPTASTTVVLEIPLSVDDPHPNTMAGAAGGSFGSGEKDGRAGGLAGFGIFMNLYRIIQGVLLADIDHDTARADHLKYRIGRHH